MNIKLAFIGAGKISSSMIESLVRFSKISKKNIYLYSKTMKKVNFLERKYKIQKSKSIKDLLNQTDLIFLCIKAKDFNLCAKEINKSLRKNHMIISCMAGVSLKKLKKTFPQNKVSCIMPSIALKEACCLMAVWSESRKMKKLIKNIFSHSGEIVFLNNLNQFNAFTVASSSGMGFVFEIMIYFKNWLKKKKFTDKKSEDIIVQSFLAASFTKYQSKNSLKDLRNLVCSKKGLTEEGIKHFRKNKIQKSIHLSLEKSFKKAKSIK